MKDGDAAEGITNVSVTGLERVGEEVAERDWFNSILANQKERLEESTAYIDQHLPYIVCLEDSAKLRAPETVYWP